MTGRRVPAHRAGLPAQATTFALSIVQLAATASRALPAGRVASDQSVACASTRPTEHLFTLHIEAKPTVYRLLRYAS
jgi:hypothetical protein